MPQLTTPLAKAITTLEGQLVLVSDVVMGVAVALPAHILSPKWAAIVVGAQHIALLVQRGVIKVKASNQLNALLGSPNLLKALEADILPAPAPAAVRREVVPSADQAQSVVTDEDLASV